MLYKTVPVYLGFGTSQVIGQLVIDTDKIPPYPNWHIALGYKTNSIEDYSNYELIEVGIVMNEKFKTHEPTRSDTV